MSNNPSLSVEFKAINESPVIQSIDRVSRAGQTYMDKWKEDARTSSGAYVNFWKTALREVEKETSAGLSRMSKAMSDARQKQLAMESRISLGGGYGPSLPSAPAQSSSDFLTKINAGMVNAAAMATLVGQAYQVVQTASRVIASFVEDAAKWEQIQMGLNNIEGSATAGAKALEHLYIIAKAPGIDLETASNAYLKLRSVKMEGTEAERVIKAFSNTVARGGGGSVQFQRVLEQLTQMLATGKVLQADLKFMKNSMPELASLMDKAFGTTTAEGIRNMGVNSQEFLDGILKQMELLPKAHQTLRSEMENTGVAWSRLKAAFVDTEWTKKFLQQVTSTFEHVTNLMTDNKKGLARDEYESKVKYTNMYVDYLEGKGTLSSHDEVMWKKYGIGGKNVKRINEAEAMAAYDAAGADASLTETPSDYDPNNPFKVRNRPKSASEEGKKKYDPIAADQERLRQMLEAQDEETRIRERYNATVEWLTREGVDSEAAIARANRDKMTEEVALKFQKMENLAHENKDLLARIQKESSEQQLATYAKYDAEVQAIDAKIEAREDAKAITAKIKAVQREIDKGEEVRKTLLENEKRAQEALQAYKNGEQLRAETDGLFAIELEYRNHYERINAAIFDSETQKKAMLDEFRRKELDDLNAFKQSQINIGLSGASGLFGAMAEMRKSATSEMNDSYRAMFAISKGFAIAEASLNVYGAVSKAMNDWSTANVYGRIALAGSVMAQGGNLISQISSLTYSGMFDRGGNIRAGQWGIAGENGPEIIQGPAHVTSTRDTARLIGSGSGEAKIVVNNYAGATVSTTKNNDGTLEILIQRAAEAAEDRIASGIASGGGKVSQQMTRTFGVKR